MIDCESGPRSQQINPDGRLAFPYTAVNLVWRSRAFR